VLVTVDVEVVDVFLLTLMVFEDWLDVVDAVDVAEEGLVVLKVGLVDETVGIRSAQWSGGTRPSSRAQRSCQKQWSRFDLSVTKFGRTAKATARAPL